MLLAVIDTDLLLETDEDPVEEDFTLLLTEDEEVDFTVLVTRDELLELLEETVDFTVLERVDELFELLEEAELPTLLVFALAQTN